MFPIFATTRTRDAQWSAIVAWAIDSLLADAGANAPSSTAGVDAFPIKASELGLSEDWRQRVVSAGGSYAEIYRRNLGDQSRLELRPCPERAAPRRRTVCATLHRIVGHEIAVEDAPRFILIESPSEVPFTEARSLGKQLSRPCSPTSSRTGLQSKAGQRLCPLPFSMVPLTKAAKGSL